MKSDLDESQLLYVTNRQDWRLWLEQHYRSDKEVWLVYYKKHSGKPRIEYNQAVEEALCFGWIDSLVRRLDQDRYAQKFSVRNPKSQYSQANKERLRALIARGLVAEEVLATLGDLTEQEPEFVIPPDILASIQANPRAWENLQGFSPAYIRIRIGFIEGARNRPEEFHKRLSYFIHMTEKNKRFGFGGIEKYY
jgi:uncharacterized protein YdeI (YjbR/CyaY-like superfamily)